MKLIFSRNIIFHTNDFVIGWEESDQNTCDEADKAPHELLLNKQKLKGDNTENESTNVGGPYERLERTKRYARRTFFSIRAKFSTKSLRSWLFSFF